MSADMDALNDDWRDIQRAIEVSLANYQQQLNSSSSTAALPNFPDAQHASQRGVPANEHQDQHYLAGAAFSKVQKVIGNHAGNAEMNLATMSHKPTIESHFVNVPKNRDEAAKFAQAEAAMSPVESPVKPTLENYIDEMQRTSIVHLPRLCVPSGDTWVYIDAPAQEPDQDDFTYDQIQARYSHPFQLRSSTLKALGSPFFENLLGPTAQFRIIRRRKLAGKLPMHIKYVLDLTPPNEGEDAVNLTTALSCPLGVRQWGLSADRWCISMVLVGGCDELTRLRPDNQKSPSKEKIQWIHGKETVTETVVVDDTGDSPKAKAAKAWRDGMALRLESQDPSFSRKSSTFSPKIIYEPPLDYTPIRHRFAIERVLNAIEGQDPKLDSAVKLWTTCAVAEKYGIKHSLLTDYIVRWLRAPPNTYFMEVQPEVTLKIAESLHCEALCRDVFSILVGEAALTVACGTRYTDEHYNVHHRRKEYVDEARFESWETRIQYASHAFKDRVKAQFLDLTNVQSTWVEELPEIRKLTQGSYHLASQARLYADLVDTLKHYVRGAIYHVLCSTYVAMPGPVADTGKGGALFPQREFRSTWDCLIHQERYFTRSFWEMLLYCYFSHGKSNCDMDVSEDYYISSVPNQEELDLLKAGVFKRITQDELKLKIEAYYSSVKLSALPRGLHNGGTKEEYHPVAGSSKSFVPPASTIPYRSMNTGAFLDPSDSQWKHNEPIAPDRHPFRVTNDFDVQNAVPEKANWASETTTFFNHNGKSKMPQLTHHENPFSTPINDSFLYSDDSDGTMNDDDEWEDQLVSLAQNAHLEQHHHVSDPADYYAEVRRSRDTLGRQYYYDGKHDQGERGCDQEHVGYSHTDSDDDLLPESPSLPAVITSLHGNVLAASLNPRPQVVAPLAMAQAAGPVISPDYAPENTSQAGDADLYFLPPNMASAEQEWNSALHAAQSGPKSPLPPLATPSLFNLHAFFRQVEDHLHHFAGQMLAAPPDSTLDLALTNTLVCLHEAELKFLPLWAGGNDDCTGGVFTDDVPAPDLDFVTAGPAASSGSSDFEMLAAPSTSAHSSVLVNDGFSDSLERGRVYDEDDAVWGAEADDAREALGFPAGLGLEENYDDIFVDEEDDFCSFSDSDEEEEEGGVDVAEEEEEEASTGA